MVRGLAMISRFVGTAMVFTTLTTVAFAQQPDSTITRPRAKAAPSKDAQKPKPVAQPRAANPCSEYGAGFVRMAGSDTCVRVGGSVDVGVGMSR